MRLKEKYVKAGYFWLPEQQENKIPGILTIEDGGDIELELIGLFDENINVLPGESNLGHIIGHVEQDGLVTLDNCFYTKTNISLGGISKSIVCVNRVLTGVACDKDEEITFSSLSFSVDCLDEWVGISGIKVQHDWNSNKTTTINYELPENINYFLENEMQLEICFASESSRSWNTTEARIV